MTALDTRPSEPEVDFTPWNCPKCGYANEGIRGFCAGCRRQRPAPEHRPVVPQSRPPAWPAAARPSAQPARRPSGPSFGPREIVVTVCIAVLLVSGAFAAIVRAD